MSNHINPDFLNNTPNDDESNESSSVEDSGVENNNLGASHPNADASPEISATPSPSNTGDVANDSASDALQAIPNDANSSDTSSSQPSNDETVEVDEALIQQRFEQLISSGSLEPLVESIIDFPLSIPVLHDTPDISISTSESDVRNLIPVEFPLQIDSLITEEVKASRFLCACYDVESDEIMVHPASADSDTVQWCPANLAWNHPEQFNDLTLMPFGYSICWPNRNTAGVIESHTFTRFIKFQQGFKFQTFRGSPRHPQINLTVSSEDAKDDVITPIILVDNHLQNAAIMQGYARLGHPYAVINMDGALTLGLSSEHCHSLQQREPATYEFGEADKGLLWGELNRLDLTYSGVVAEEKDVKQLDSEEKARDVFIFLESDWLNQPKWEETSVLFWQMCYLRDFFQRRGARVHLLCAPSHDNKGRPIDLDFFLSRFILEGDGWVGYGFECGPDYFADPSS